MPSEAKIEVSISQFIAVFYTSTEKIELPTEASIEDWIEQTDERGEANDEKRRLRFFGMKIIYLKTKIQKLNIYIL